MPGGDDAALGKPSAAGLPTRSGAAPFSRTAVLLAAIVVVSLVVRIGHLVSAYPTPQFSYHRAWVASDMYIFDQWAQRIADGDLLGRQKYQPVLNWMLRAAPAERWAQWFGDAPTYFKAPFYAYLLALLRWLFGDAMLPVAILQIMASALCTLLLFAVTKRLFDKTSGLLAALLFAVYAPGIHYDVVMLRGPWIVLVSLLVTWQLILLRPRPTGRAVCLLGLANGCALLVNEGFLFLPPLVLGLVACWVRDIKRITLLSGAFLFGLALALSPVIIRNLIVGAPPLQLAVTGAPMLAMMNASDSDPLFLRAPPPSFQRLMEQSGGKLVSLVWMCLRTFRGLGDVLKFYMHRAAGLVAPFEIPDNSNFYYAALKDPLLRLLPTYAVLFPLAAVGFALSVRKLKDLQPLVPVSLALLVSTMGTLPVSRYRVPLVVLLFPFAGAALAQAIRWVRERRWHALAGAAAGIVLVFVVAALLQRHVVSAGGDLDFFRYRQPEFQMAALLYAKENRFREASQELVQLAQLNPRPSVRSDALMRAARLQVQAGDPAGARESLQQLSELSFNNAPTLVMIGDLYWQMLADPSSALVAYRKAKELHPSGALDAALTARLAQLEAALQKQSIHAAPSDL